jgi:hypothetical protein
MTRLEPPGPDEVFAITRGIAAAVAPAGGLAPIQRELLAASVRALTGVDADEAIDDVGPHALDELDVALADRNLAFRQRIVQQMVLCALVLRPLPDEVVERVAAAAQRLGVDEAMLGMARQLSAGHFALAAIDFERNGYTANWNDEQCRVLHTSGTSAVPWQEAPADPALAARWQALGDLSEGSLGLAVWRFYRARGFHFPGTPGSVSPLLAQHDWVHVLADYGATIPNELEVFGFIARANDDPAGFSFLAMVVSLFETGYLRSGAGIFEAAPGHLRQQGTAVRLADAMRRGALTNGSNDFLAVDWFTLADQPLAEVRAHFGVVPKSADAVAAGSPGPFDAGGMTSFQYEAGQAAAVARGEAYASWGATPA